MFAVAFAKNTLCISSSNLTIPLSCQPLRSSAAADESVRRNTVFNANCFPFRNLPPSYPQLAFLDCYAGQRWGRQPPHFVLRNARRLQFLRINHSRATTRAVQKSSGQDSKWSVTLNPVVFQLDRNKQEVRSIMS